MDKNKVKVHQIMQCPTKFIIYTVRSRDMAGTNIINKIMTYERLEGKEGRQMCVAEHKVDKYNKGKIFINTEVVIE